MRRFKVERPLVTVWHCLYLGRRLPSTYKLEVLLSEMNDVKKRWLAEANESELPSKEEVQKGVLVNELKTVKKRWLKEEKEYVNYDGDDRKHMEVLQRLPEVLIDLIPDEEDAIKLEYNPSNGRVKQDVIFVKFKEGKIDIDEAVRIVAAVCEETGRLPNEFSQVKIGDEHYWRIWWD